MITVSIYDEAISSTLTTPLVTIGDIDTYSHNIIANGGFDTASFTFSVPISDMWKWDKERLGLPVKARGPAGEIVWEGFIDGIDLAAGGVSMSIGPLMDIANKVSVKYMTVDYAIVFLPSEAAITGWAEDQASQERYYIFEEIVSAGSETSDALAEDLRDSYLAEFSQPAISQSVNVSGGGGSASITVRCLGWYHMLNAFYYLNNDVGGVGEYNADQKIADILDYDLNSLFSSDNASIDTNTIQVPVPENGEMPGLSVIQKVVNYGDASGNRWLYAVYEDRTFEYRQVTVDLPASLGYIYNISETKLYDTQGVEVKPWRARPGTWMRIGGLLNPPAPTFSNARESDDMVYVESVDFSTPNNLSMSGGRFRTIDQRIARLGIAGIQ